MTQAQQFEKSFLRPANYFDLSEERQWEIDKRLGILDWDGSCSHSTKMCKQCEDKFKKHYN